MVVVTGFPVSRVFFYHFLVVPFFVVCVFFVVVCLFDCFLFFSCAFFLFLFTLTLLSFGHT